MIGIGLLVGEEGIGIGGSRSRVLDYAGGWNRNFPGTKRFACYVPQIYYAAYIPFDADSEFMIIII